MLNHRLTAVAACAALFLVAACSEPETSVVEPTGPAPETITEIADAPQAEIPAEKPAVKPSIEEAVTSATASATVERAKAMPEAVMPEVVKPEVVDAEAGTEEPKTLPEVRYYQLSKA